MEKNKLLTIVIALTALIGITMVSLAIRELVQEIRYSNEINRILSDNYEIEKKWIIDKNNIPYDLSKAEVIKIEQTYICFSPEIRVRRINDGEQYSFAVKTNMTSDGMTRDEFEKEISKEEYDNLVKKQEGNTIYKTRYQLLDDEYLLAFDIYSGELDGLAYLEIEFENQDEANKYETPSWIIKDVTGDIEYKNGHLARYGIPSSFFEYIK